MLENPFLIVQKRSGDFNDPFRSISETLKIDSNGKVMLSELPNQFERVVITGDNKTWLEIKLSEIPADNEFQVDYKKKTVTFNAINIGKQLNFQYKGEGMSFVNAENIYTTQENGKITETLQQILDVKTVWKTPVNTYSALATTYPFPSNGWTVQTLDDSKFYRYENGQWLFTQQYSAVALTDLQNKVDNIIVRSTTAPTNTKVFWIDLNS